VKKKNTTEKDKWIGTVLERIRRYGGGQIPIVKLRPPEGILSNLYMVGDWSVVHIKNATIRKSLEYTFRYDARNRAALWSLRNADLFLALVCKDEELICCISYDKLLDLTGRARRWNGMIYVNYDDIDTFRVYLDGRVTKRIYNPIVTRLNDFPKMILR
jgi:hypothetical protein